MARFTILILAVGGLLQLFSAPAAAQLGNTDWETLWVIHHPAAYDTTSEYNWMFGNSTYTGLAYDKWNDVVYVVNPGVCSAGSLSYKCPRIYALDAETGAIATRIQSANSQTPAGQVYVNTTVVGGSFARGQYPIFKIDLDDQGRIYAANVVAPVFGICYPGPPPNCLPDYLSQGPFKIYRWDTPEGEPELIYESGGTTPQDSELKYTMWGTSLDVVGRQYEPGDAGRDSVRIYASGGKFYVGYFDENNELDCFLPDSRPSAPYKYRFGLKMTYASGSSSFASHGIAVTGESPYAPVYADANRSDVVFATQSQTTAAFPQFYDMQGIYTLPNTVTGYSGPIAYYLDTLYNRPYLICADGLPSSSGIGTTNTRTSARMVDLSTGPNWQNWPPSVTPALGSERFNNLTGEDNWITDVDYKIWVSPVDGKRYMQLFVLMSRNGIASYRMKSPVHTAAPPAPVPGKMTLAQNYPNPFGTATGNPGTSIAYTIDRPGRVTLSVYSLLGNKITDLVDDEMAPGSYTAHFNAERLPAGVYLYTLKANGATIQRQMVLMK